MAAATLCGQVGADTADHLLRVSQGGDNSLSNLKAATSRPPTSTGEARGLDVIIRGLSMVCDDDETLAVTARLYDGRCEHRRRATMLDGEPS